MTGRRVVALVIAVVVAPRVGVDAAAADAATGAGIAVVWLTIVLGSLLRLLFIIIHCILR